MLRFLRRTFGRRSMQRYGRAAGEGDERDGAPRAASAGAPLAAPGAPAPPHIQAAATGGRAALQCRVQLLDGTEVSVELPFQEESLCDISSHDNTSHLQLKRNVHT